MKFTKKQRTESENEIVGDGYYKIRMTAISASFFLGFVLMCAKFYAYKLTNSSAVLSDALESIINVVASAFALFSIWISAKPPDKEHPYGHGKIENFSAGFEGALIIIAAVGIFVTGFSHIIVQHTILHIQEGWFILIGASVVNLILGISLVKIGKKTGSFALIADGKHIMTDVYTSAGVVIGLLLVYLTGWFWLDGAVACMVGVNILVTGGALVRQSFSELMDTSDPDLLNQISSLLAAHRKRYWIDIHKLRAWRAGSFIHIDFHLVLPRDFSLEKADLEATELEEIIVAYFKGNASVLIHMDPCDQPECRVCSRYRCDLRADDQKVRVAWETERLTKPGSSGEK